MNVNHILNDVTPIKRRYTFWINDTEANGLRQVKAEEGISESEQIRQAIRDWLRKKRAKAELGTRGKLGRSS